MRVRWFAVLVAAALACLDLLSGVHAQTAQPLPKSRTLELLNATDGPSFEEGTRFELARSEHITAVRHWKISGDGGAMSVECGLQHAPCSPRSLVTGQSASDWQQQTFATPLAVQADTVYTISANTKGNSAATVGGLITPSVNSDTSFVEDGQKGGFESPAAFPTDRHHGGNDLRDPVLVAAAVGSATRLVLTPASTSVQTGNVVSYTATIQDANGNRVTKATNPISFSISGVSGSFNPPSPVSSTRGSATSNFTPSSAGIGTVTASASGLTSATATVVVSNPSAGSQSLFTTQTPTVASTSDGVPYEIGMKFRLARSGSITAIRYWKASADTGTPVGRIWSSSGTLLASVAFSGESASGWQQQSLAAPLAVQPNTTYIVSVNVGSRYPVSAGGLANPIINGDISSVADGANGVYGTPFAFPTNSWQNSNYFRDIVFVANSAGAASKLALTPTNSTGQIGTPVTYTAAVQDTNGNTVTTATNSISFSVSGVSGSFSPASPVPASNGVATSSFTPTAAGSANITASAPGLTSATAALSVSATSTQKSLFTNQIPATSNATDGGAYELGMKFRVARSGQISSIRYWKSASDSGLHTGRIWSSTGTLLASVSFVGETGSGWQSQPLEPPLVVQPNTTYTVSVNIGSHFPVTVNGLASSLVNGDISSVADGNNGVFGTPGGFPTQSYQNSNYFRDIGFVADSAGAPPTVIARSPQANAQGIAVNTGVSATFNKSVQQASINFKLTGPSNTMVPGTLTYNDTNRTATLQPNTQLAPLTSYTASVSGATDSAGQSMSAPDTWTFTTGSVNLGQWSPVYPWPCVAIHMHLLPDGKVLSWADDDTASRDAGFTKTYVVDVPTDGPPGASIFVPNTTTNLFCAGHTFLPDGRLITTGGHNGMDMYGATDVVIFEYQNAQYGWFIQPAQMNAGRWYPSTASLSNGEAVVLGGSEINGTENPLPQVWQTNTGGGLRDLTSAVRVMPWYPRIHLAPNGKLFVAAPDQNTSYLDTTGTGQWTNVANRLYGYRDYGSSVMYDAGKLLMVGGSDPPTATAEIIDLNAAAPTWQFTGAMQFARRQMNATLLPDGKVLATGGTSSAGFSDARSPVLAAEMWDPVTGQWSTMASMQVPRLYHSTALLLPDGRVLSAGGGRPASYSAGVDNWNVELYSPPYLFKGARPVIASAPTRLSYGVPFSIQTPDAAGIADVTLVRLSSVTHSFNMNQRFNRLVFTRTAGVLNVTAPSNRNITPPGHYMMFILNQNGVPSIAKIVQIL